MMRSNHSEEDFKSAYYQQFNILDSHDKSIQKTLKVVKFTFQERPRDFPKFAILKPFYKVLTKYKKEAKFLEDLSALHPNIVKHYYHTEFDGTFRIFMEYCDCGSVSKVIERRKNENTPWTDSELINHFITIAGVIEILHSNNYIHRDMKPDNIFVKNHEVLRIGDFGESKEIRIGESKYTANGTEIYMSPSYLEHRKSLPVDKADGKKRSEENRLKEEEVWSVGKTFYEMAALDLYANFPASENEIFEIVDNKLRNRPANLILLLKWMLADDYKNRPKIGKVLELLQKIGQEIETSDPHDTTRLGTNSTDFWFKGGNAESIFLFQGFNSNKNGLIGDFYNPHSSDKRYYMQSDSVKFQEEIKQGLTISTNTQEEIKQGETISANHQEEVKQYEKNTILEEEFDSDENNGFRSINSCELCNSDELTHDCGYKYCKDEFFKLCQLFIEY